GLDDDCDGEVDEALDAGEVCGGDVCGPDLPTLTVDAGRTGDTRGLADDHAGSACVPEATGPDQVLRFQAQAGEHVVGVAPLSADYDPVFWVARGCDTLNQCTASLGSGRVQAGRPKARRGVLAAGEHVVVVDGRDAAGGAYALSLRPFSAGETCARAVALPLPGRLVGTLDGRANDHAGQRCPIGLLTTGADQAVRFELAAAATVRVRLTPDTSWMPTVYVVRDCAQVDNTCAGSARANAPGQILDFTAELAAGTWYVVVERPSAQQAGGEFLLELSPE
ncbi:MAG: hypothetical protein KC613_03030, partial [Myxococcales bacterium]|nr:hypothetical protein [Myxococcales bacterium]